MKRQPTLPCPTCHGFARAPIADGRSACTRCGTVLPPLPWDGGTNRPRLPHTTPLRVGMKATIGGKEFVTVGRVRFTQNDAGETSTWEEWVLLHPDGDARYLEYDAGKWTLSEPYAPHEAPSFARLGTVRSEDGAAGDMLRIDGHLVSVTDAGACQVSGVEGEIPWPVAVGDRVRYVDLQSGDAFFSAELADDGTVEWFRGRRMDDRAVFTLFDLRDLITALNRREAALKGRRGFGAVCLVAALVALIGWGAARGRGKIVAQNNVPLASVGQEGVRMGPYPLTAAGRVHRLRVSSNLSQSAAWVQAVIEDDAGELFDTSGEFWDETGYDEDGQWHEYNLQAQSDFRLDRAGSVYVRLRAEPEAAARSGGASVSFAIEQGVLYAPYLGFFGAGALVLGGIFLLAGSPGLARGVWNSMRTS